MASFNHLNTMNTEADKQLDRLADSAAYTLAMLICTTTRQRESALGTVITKAKEYIASIEEYESRLRVFAGARNKR